MNHVVIKWLKWLSLGLISLLLSVLIGLGVLLFTNSGLNLALWAVQSVVPQLKVESSQGTILPRFSLNNLRFKDDDLHIDTQLKSVTLALDAACLTKLGICIDELAIDGLSFSMPSLPPSSGDEKSEPNQEMSKTSWPIPIQLNRLTLNDIRLDILSNQVTWQSFTSSVSLQGRRLRIGKTNWLKPVVKIAPSKAQSAPPEPEQSLQQQLSQAIVLPEVHLPLQFDIERLDITDFKLDQSEPIIIHHLGLQGGTRGSTIMLNALELDMPQLDAKMRSEIELKGDYPLSLSLGATIKDPFAAGQRVSLKLGGSVAELDLSAKLSGLATADLSAKLALLTPYIPFDFKLTKGNFKWPLKGKSDYSTAVEKITANGNLNAYRLNIKADVNGERIPESGLWLQGRGDLSHLNLSQINITTLGGSLSGDISADWQKSLKWGANLALSHIQPSLQWPQAEGDISGVITTRGHLTPQGGWAVEVPKLDIDGILRQYPLNIAGSVSAKNTKGNNDLQVQTPQLVVSHGPNEVKVSGELEKQWQLDFAINLPDLQKSVPNLQGRVAGGISVRGQLKEPEIGIDLSANQLDWQQQAQVAELTLKGDLTSLPQPSGQLTLNLNQVQYQDNTIKDAALNISGSEQQHQVQLDVNSNIISTHLALSGKLSQKPVLDWQAKLENMTLALSQGEWRLNRATDIEVNIDKQQLSLAAHCWLQADSSLCLEKDIKVGKQGEVALALNHFDFAQLKAFLPQSTQLQGRANAKAWAKWGQKISPQVTASVELSKGKVVKQLDQSLELGWQSAELNAQLANNKLQSEWLIDVTDNGDISGEATIPNVLQKNKQIEGHVKLTTFNLDFLAPFVGELSKLKSNISTDLAITGPIMQPKINGKLSVDDVLLKGEISPIDVDSGRLVVDFAGYNAKLSSGLHTPDGKITLTGDADWHDIQQWSTKLHLMSDQLMVKSPPIVRVKVQPDLTIAITPKLARLDGSIALPWGRVVVEELPPSAVEVSKDQVIVDARLHPIEEQNTLPFKLESNIKLNIGNDFKLAAFGLESHLVGNLSAVQKEKGPFVSGEVDIINGLYRSFGQDLVIQEGKILLSGPVDEPYLRIRAIRNPDNTQDGVIAGVKVTGLVSEPIVTIFSEPAMPQANALSYLLRGQDIDGKSGGSVMTTTLIGLSLAKSGRVVGEIGKAFGVQDLQLDTAGSGDKSQVTVSGYILPDLKVKYGVGIFDSVGEFTMRYRLVKELYVEAVSGASNAVDLLYQFEFD